MGLLRVILGYSAGYLNPITPPKTPKNGGATLLRVIFVLHFAITRGSGCCNLICNDKCEMSRPAAPTDPAPDAAAAMCTNVK
jgi:hypothetical protein